MFDWDAVDTVLLDMDGTLLDLHFDNYFWLTHLPKRYAETHGVDEAEAMSRLQAHIKAHEGTLNWYCTEFWSKSLDVNIVELKKEVQSKVQIRPFVMEFLQALRQMNKRLVLVTNAHPHSVDLKFEITNIDRCLDMVISSHEFDQPKEAQEFWQQLWQQEQFDPERTVFIDDTVKILDSARDFGIKHLLCIHQPDSQREHRQITAYPAFNHFDEIMPKLPLVPDISSQDHQP